MMQDVDERAQEHVDEQHMIMDHVRQLITEIDADHSGELSAEEWEIAMDHGKLLPYLESIGLRASHAVDVFYMFLSQSESGCVDLETYLEACMGLKGNSTPFNILRVERRLFEI